MEEWAAEFEALVATYERRIYTLLLRMVSDPEEAADLTQETFVRAYRAFAHFRREAQPYTWLYRIAVNLARDHLAKRQRRRQREIEFSALETEEREGSFWEPPDKQPSLEEQLIRQELHQQIANALQQMSDDYREVLLLREFEQMSYEEIAQTLGITVEAVRARLARARAWLRQRLEGYLSEA